MKKLWLCMTGAALSCSAFAVELEIIHSAVVNDSIYEAQCPAGVALDSQNRYVTVFSDGGDGVAGCTNYFARTCDLGKSWSEVFHVIKPDKSEVGTGIGFTQLPDGRVLGTKIDISHTDTSREGFKSYRTSKTDVIEVDPDTGEIKVLFRLKNPDDSMNPTMANGIIQLSNGELLLPAYIFCYAEPKDKDFPYGSGFYRSKDGGKTWGDFELAYIEPDPENKISVNETAIIEAADGDLVIYGRTDAKPVNHTYRVISEDKGKTWSVPEKMDMDIIYPVAIKTKAGDYLMICGDRKAPIPRTDMIYYSKDGKDFTRLGMPRYTKPGHGGPYNTGTGGLQAIIEVEPDVFLMTFYSCEPIDEKPGYKVYIDSCLFRLKRKTALGDKAVE